MLNVAFATKCLAQISSPLLENVFPPSLVNTTGQTGYSFDTTLVDFDNQNWNHNWDEANVFRIQLEHEDYTLRVGKGSQLYSINTPIGEICPPQNAQHAWIDDTWLMTCYFNELDDTMQYVNDNYNSNLDWFKPFVHSCGVYGHQEPDMNNYPLPEDWWAPLLAERLDTIENSYSTVTLGFQSNAPSYPRGDMLFYQKIRDIGDGAFEMTYMTYYFNTSFDPDENYTTHWSPWGGVRTSIFPERLKSNPDQTWLVDNTYHGQPGHSINVNNTGGWGVCTQANSVDSSYSLGYVYGSEKPSWANKSYIHGYAASTSDVNLDTLPGERNFTVIASRLIMSVPPGQTFFNRLFFVLGERDEVINRCVDLESQVEHEFLSFTQEEAVLKPVYLEEYNNQFILSDTGTNIAGYVFAEPVDDSKPLFLVKNQATGDYHATADPYMTMPKYPIPNTPYMGWRPYDGTTEIIKLIGFVMPQSQIDTSHNYVPLESILTDNTYFPQNGIYDLDLMIVESDQTTEIENTMLGFDVQLFPNPVEEELNININGEFNNDIQIKVTDIAGRTVLLESIKGNLSQSGKIDLSDLNVGIYFVTIKMKGKTQTFKIVKH